MNHFDFNLEGRIRELISAARLQGYAMKDPDMTPEARAELKADLDRLREDLISDLIAGS